MSGQKKKPKDVVSSWWIERGEHELEDIDGYINEDITNKDAQGYDFVRMTALPLGKGVCVVSLHFSLRPYQP